MNVKSKIENGVVVDTFNLYGNSVDIDETYSNKEVIERTNNYYGVNYGADNFGSNKERMFFLAINITFRIRKILKDHCEQ